MNDKKIGIIMENTNKDFGPNDYILFMAQEANFQTRSMLIPVTKFLLNRKNDYEILKKHSIKNYKITLDNIDYIIDNLLIKKLIPHGSFANCLTCENNEYNKICGELAHYADGMDGYFDVDDENWYDEAICYFCGGFNHIKNYCKYKNETVIKDKNINIIDSFLVLEAENNKIRLPMFDEVDEMFLATYHQKLSEAKSTKLENS
jgi:hypothetical protein